MVKLDSELQELLIDVMKRSKTHKYIEEPKRCAMLLGRSQPNMVLDTVGTVGLSLL